MKTVRIPLIIDASGNIGFPESWHQLQPILDKGFDWANDAQIKRAEHWAILQLPDDIADALDAAEENVEKLDAVKEQEFGVTEKRKFQKTKKRVDR